MGIEIYRDQKFVMSALTLVEICDFLALPRGVNLLIIL